MGALYSSQEMWVPTRFRIDLFSLSLLGFPLKKSCKALKNKRFEVLQTSKKTKHKKTAVLQMPTLRDLVLNPGKDYNPTLSFILTCSLVHHWVQATSITAAWHIGETEAIIRDFLKVSSLLFCTSLGYYFFLLL